MEEEFSLTDIKSRISKDSNGTSNYMNVYISEMDWLVEQAEKAEKYENALKEIAAYHKEREMYSMFTRIAKKCLEDN